MVVQQWLQSEDVDSREESAWLNSSGLELDGLTQRLPTVSVGAIGSYYSRKRQYSLNTIHSPESSHCNGVGHFDLILRHSGFKF